MENYRTTKQQLIDTVLPVQTRTYKPVPHERLMDLTLNALLKAGFDVDQEQYSCAKEGMVAYGKYVIGNVSDNEMKLQILWQNSYDKTKVLTFAIGAMVLVCTNGMVSFRTANSFRKKHTGEIQEITPQIIESYISQAGDTFLTLQKDRDVMKNIIIDRKTSAELIGRMYIEEEFIESTQLNIIRKQLYKSTYDYGAPNSLWELYQHTTYAIGGIHPSRWMEDHIAAHEFFVNAAGILVKKEEIVAPEYTVQDPSQLSIDFDSVNASVSEAISTYKDSDSIDTLVQEGKDLSFVEEVTTPSIEIVEEVIEEIPPLHSYKVVIMSDDPNLLDTDDPHQKYVYNIDAINADEAVTTARNKFLEENPELPIYWTKSYNM